MEAGPEAQPMRRLRGSGKKVWSWQEQTGIFTGLRPFVFGRKKLSSKDLISHKNVEFGGLLHFASRKAYKAPSLWETICF